jgi:hypothetical protein
MPNPTITRIHNDFYHQHQPHLRTHKVGVRHTENAVNPRPRTFDLISVAKIGRFDDVRVSVPGQWRGSVILNDSLRACERSIGGGIGGDQVSSLDAELDCSRIAEDTVWRVISQIEAY